MGEERRRSERRWRGGGCGGGCASIIVVLTLGLLLSLFNVAIGIGVSVRVPFTSNVNITLAGSVGKKDKAPDALPSYVHGKLGGNQNFVNGSQTLTIWVAEGDVIFVAGQQEGAPIFDLHLEAR
ncbi:MAG TPA: hypothetical protein VJS19_05325 [Candidatus Dormibacteraeota bacterium]|nr:hypothetical protein [Candidatus Dormibacteraeota bacterium]